MMFFIGPQHLPIIHFMGSMGQCRFNPEHIKNINFDVMSRNVYLPGCRDTFQCLLGYIRN